MVLFKICLMDRQMEYRKVLFLWIFLLKLF
jgi:hypothetical protein